VRDTRSTLGGTVLCQLSKGKLCVIALAEVKKDNAAELLKALVDVLEEALVADAFFSQAVATAEVAVVALKSNAKYSYFHIALALVALDSWRQHIILAHPLVRPSPRLSNLEDKVLVIQLEFIFNLH